MHFFSQTRIQSWNFVFLILLLVLGLFTTSAFAQGPPEFSESFYTLLLNDDDDNDIMEGLEMCSTRFRAALTRGLYQERASRETEELVSSCNRDRSSPAYIEQCVLESTQNTVDLILILSVQSIRRRGFIFEARMTRTMGEATIWGDSVHIEDEDIIVLAAQEACNQLAASLAVELNIDSSPNINSNDSNDSNDSNNLNNSNDSNDSNDSNSSWSVFEFVNVSPRIVTVNIDGVEVGTTPNQFEISPGPHVLTLSTPGYISLERNVQAPENNTLILNDLVLDPMDAILTITSNVAGASIIVDGQQINTTIPSRPIQVEIPPNSRALEVQRDGYITWRQTLNLAPGQNEAFSIELVLIPEQTALEEQTTSEERINPERRTAPEGFVLIPAGSFRMGSRRNESGQDPDERRHRVRITNSFYMQTYEVTQGEWQTLIGNNPSYFSSSGDGANCGSSCPVENVNWWEVLVYANALSNSEGLQECYVLSDCRNEIKSGAYCTGVSLNSDCGYRLPTEAEWEYAARAGTRTAYYNRERTPDDIAWYGEDLNTGSTHRVGLLEANSWGLYDMSGNVWEWCWDWYGADYYNSLPTNDPMGPDSGSYRVARGGSWYDSASRARSAYRYYNDPSSHGGNLGFRLVISAP